MTGNKLLIAGVIMALAMGVNGCSYPAEPGATETPGTTETPADPALPGQPPATVPVQGVRVTPQVMQFFAIGESRQVSATIAPLDATDKALTWESSDSAVATVDSHGLVTAKANGVGVFVTAYTHDGHHQASVNVSVNP